jgi:hypothetical protein
MDDGCLRWAHDRTDTRGGGIPSGTVECECHDGKLLINSPGRQPSVKLAEPRAARVGVPPGGHLQPPQPGPLLAWYPWCPALLPAAWCSPAAIRTALPGSVLNIVPSGNYVYHSTVCFKHGILPTE